MRSFRVFVASLSFFAMASPAQERLDPATMRSDFFAAYGGSREATQRLLMASEVLLATDPDHAQALAWHGSTLLVTGMPNPATTPEEQQAARNRFAQGMTELNSRQMPPRFSETMLERARSDFQRIFEIEQENIDNLGTHRLGEVLQAAARDNALRVRVRGGRDSREPRRHGARAGFARRALAERSTLLGRLAHDPQMP